MAKIYVASSWRNQYYPEVVNKLREFGHEVYDFRNPPHDHGAFMWKNVDPDFDKWTVNEYKQGLQHPSSERVVLADDVEFRMETIARQDRIFLRSLSIMNLGYFNCHIGSYPRTQCCPSFR